MSNRTCTISQRPFTVESSDMEFYQAIDVPPPTLHPIERSRRRNAHRNESNLFWRECSSTGSKILSLYPTDTNIAVISEKEYFSDCWDPGAYGRGFDFSRTFFDQWHELKLSVPHLALNSSANENCDYCAYTGWSKDCYLTFHADHNRDCLYLSFCFYNTDCVDCAYVNRSELCYECLTSEQCYDCSYAQDCTNCSQCTFVTNCIGCSHCFGCVNLRNKSYCLFNKQLSKAEYERQVAQMDLSDAGVLHKLNHRYEEFLFSQPHKAIRSIASEHCTGDYIRWSKNVEHAYHVEHCRDAKFIADCQRLVDSYDVDSWGGTGAQLLYECETVGEGANSIFFTSHSFDGVHDLWYSYNCQSSHDLFGCIGMRHRKYCILNKQYTPTEYAVQKEKIVAHMKSTREWGEYFPVELSPFPYNITKAHELYPLSKEEVLARGWRWDSTSHSGIGPATMAHPPPAKLSDFGEAQIDSIWTCELSSKEFRITKQELDFHRRKNIALPRCCFAERHKRRTSKLNPRRLHLRNCAGCQSEMQTSYQPEFQAPLLCQDCFATV